MAITIKFKSGATSSTPTISPVIPSVNYVVPKAPISKTPTTTKVFVPTTPVIKPKTNLLSEAFDQKEDYVQKFKKGDIGGGIANLAGATLTSAQSAYLNVANNLASLAQGKGTQPLKYQMSYADYEKAVSDRGGVKPTSEIIKTHSPLLGNIYKMALEIGTDPLELTPAGFLNDIKVAKGGLPTAASLQKAVVPTVVPKTTAQIPPQGSTIVSDGVLPKAEPIMPIKEITPTISRPSLLKKQERIVSTNKAIPTDEKILSIIKSETNKNVSQILKGSSASEKEYINKSIEDYSNNKIDMNSLYEIIESAVNRIPYSMPVDKSIIASMKSYLKSGIKVTDDLRQIPDFADFRRNNAGKIKFSPNGSDVDSLYDELSDQFGNIFPKDVSHPVDRLNKIIDAIKPSGLKQTLVGDALTKNEIVENFIIPIFNEAEDLKELSKTTTKIKESVISNPIFKGKAMPLDGLKKDLGADIYKGDKTTEQLVKEFGAMPKGEIPFRDVSVPKKTDYGDVQQFLRTMAESEVVDDTLLKELDSEISSFTKSNISNATAVDDANVTIAKGIDTALEQFKSIVPLEKQATSRDIALGSRLIQELQKQGRYTDALDAAIDLSQMLSETGRSLQAARIIKRLTPEGRLKAVATVSERMSKKYGKTIKPSEKTLKRIAEAKTEKEILDANKKAGVEMWNKTPPNLVDKLNSWRYTAMLFNPKTHIRNIVGNTLFIPAREFKNLIGSGLESAARVPVGQRTKAVLDPRATIPERLVTDSIRKLPDYQRINFARKDFDNVVSTLKGEGKIDDAIRDVEAKVFGTGKVGEALGDTSKPLQKVIAIKDMYKALGIKEILPETAELIKTMNLGTLNLEDTWFMKLAYDGSLAQYMKANKLNPADMVGSNLETARKYALNEALKATYRDANALSTLISKGKNKLSHGVKEKMLWDGSVVEDKLGTKLMRTGSVALEGIIPFAKTPLNIIKRGIGYSPANIVRGTLNLVSDVKNGKNPAEALDQIASGLSGSSVIGLGAYLGSKGIVTGNESDFTDKDYNYNQMTGSQNYSINIDGNSYTIDWAAPLSMLFFVGVELSNLVKEGKMDLVRLLDSMTKISDPMVNLSMLKGINTLLSNNYDGLSTVGTDLVSSYVGQYNPTVFGQIARTADDTRRQTVSTKERGLEKEASSFLMKQQAKIPGLSQKLQPYVNLWGQEESSGTAVENFLSPGYFRRENVTDVDREILSLKNSLDEETYKSIIPRKTGTYTVTENKIPYRMSEEELTRFSKTRGQKSFNLLNKLFDTSEYKTSDDTEKAKLIKSAYDDAFEVAKAEFLRNKGVSQ